MPSPQIPENPMTASFTVGANFAETHTSPKFNLGDRAYGADSTEWVYVQADGAITKYDCVGVDENFQASPATSAIGNAAWAPAFAQVAFADNEYGWVATRGSNIYVRAKSAVPDTQLYVGTASGGTGTAGVVVSTTATSLVKLNGVVLITTASAGTAEAIEIMATNPFFTA
jgi:hypothetical protein